MGRVQHFRYLRIDVAADGNADLSVKSRLHAAWMSWKGVHRCLLRPALLQDGQMKGVPNSGCPTMFDGSEYWLVIESHE
ncbi:hypothetical protein V3C99_005023, partial [Haemonchus contortus]